MSKNPEFSVYNPRRINKFVLTRGHRTRAYITRRCYKIRLVYLREWWSKSRIIFTECSCIKISTEKKKKKVVFADDRGFALEQVKFMTEPSHVPPYWALKVVSSPSPERKPPPAPIVDLWESRFAQPASDYVEFRRRITQDCVTLENVIIKQNECAVDGTVKVKNLDFGKEVFVRASSDGWTTSEDTYCAFVESGPLGPNGTSLYDTFGFRLQLPIHSRRLDFCVCFRCKGSEYWDNNKGHNYTIEKSSVRNTPGVSCARIKYGNSWTSRSDSTGNTPYW
ncbi:hypothetical protein O3G_MSEX012483 [Manduca sexta]|uniref:CBM21 domain-containing protein n=1 Tax=Manduca sexta TaxID=7130 RepID=A0A921ZPA2_MANSE|nr:hypothetical protein O3G_MSEX012483 [Manduca sexta]